VVARFHHVNRAHWVPLAHHRLTRRRNNTAPGPRPALDFRPP